MFQAKIGGCSQAFLWLLAGSILAAACSSTTGTNAPDERGTLEGYVRLVDTTGVGTSSNDVTISIPLLGVTTRTDSVGQWTMSGVPIGTYEIEATKQAYGRMKWFNVPVTGPGTYYLQTVTMFPVPAWHLSLDSIQPTADGGVQLFGMISEAKSWSYIWLSIDADSNTLPNSAHLIQDGPSYNFQGTGPHWRFSASGSLFKGLLSGRKVFLSVFGNRGEQDFFDPGIGQSLPVSPSQKSNSISFIIP